MLRFQNGMGHIEEVIVGLVFRNAAFPRFVKGRALDGGNRLDVHHGMLKRIEVGDEGIKVLLLPVVAYDETAVTLHAVLFQNTHCPVVHFHGSALLIFLQFPLLEGLQPYKKGVKAVAGQQSHQFLVLCDKIRSAKGQKGLADAPLLQPPAEVLQALGIKEEIIIYNKDIFLLNLLQLVQHIRHLPLEVGAKLGTEAERAVVGAAERGLDGGAAVVVDVVVVWAVFCGLAPVWVGETEVQLLGSPAKGTQFLLPFPPFNPCYHTFQGVHSPGEHHIQKRAVKVLRHHLGVDAPHQSNNR